LEEKFSFFWKESFFPEEENFSFEKEFSSEKTRLSLSGEECSFPEEERSSAAINLQEKTVPFQVGV